MSKEKLPRLREEDVRRLADEQSFARGKAYYRDGAIQNPVIQERELRAECVGSRYEPYRVRVSFGENGTSAWAAGRPGKNTSGHCAVNTPASPPFRRSWTGRGCRTLNESR